MEKTAIVDLVGRMYSLSTENAQELSDALEELKKSPEEILEILLADNLENSGHLKCSPKYREAFFNKHRKSVTKTITIVYGGASKNGEALHKSNRTHKR